ncbi:MAG: flavin reductase [Gammaproteobacteria bacterium]|nr:flavin reductase [Gammaproteobacteria bacterium]MCY4218454.1 flavin reductase [Gammaproteobacteria bacterium]MCY4274522.1 flavin reductase [Gammaproteobacteria bacterium]
MNQKLFLEGMSHAACTVSVLTTDGPNGRGGITISAMTSVSADPPTLLVCVHHLSPTCEKIIKNGVFCVNVLSEDQSRISDIFAGRVHTPDEDKFSCDNWITRSTGAPNLANALIAFDCKVKSYNQVGTHYIFVAQPEEINIRKHGNVLIYANRAYGFTRNLDEFVAEKQTNEDTEVIYVACFATIGPFFIPRLVRTFLEKIPDTAFQFFEGSEHEIEQVHRTSPFDLILMYDSPAISGSNKTTLATVNPHILLPSGHPLCKHHEISLHDLTELPMILLDITPSRNYFTSLFHEYNLKPTIRFRSPSFETVRGMVANGLGYSILVSRPASSMSYDGSALVTRPIKEYISPAELVMRHNDSDKISHRLNRFVEHTKDFFDVWTF